MAKKCMRCQAVIDNNFCAACGINYGDNVDSPKGRLAQADIEIEKALSFQRMMRAITRWLFGWRM